ncbi:NADH-ubiquinone oxidoreductase-F iron-sulfur binding region domain-containing protein [Cellulomonas sp. KRMCY2]|uniref:NADH-ubiquinone oxidoreductase-F iron-sulfur binding region domain-containing protein n=1 Tax=Cellulomonas sp. KRMCY2 TaxID=1304865 RepID=UPI0004B49554|nr:NADH-ubiquinone oxidoreductase-F iron-sulfur binding region domain-containing protein [Cellulomonas sp. KRMCY2]
MALIARGYPPVATLLLTVLTPVDRLVLEVPRGTRVAEVMRETGWLRAGPPQALLLGGFGGSWAPWRDLEHRTFDEDDLRALGLSVGAGVVAPIPSSACGVAETAAIAGYLAAMSARQCGPCHFGLPALADSMGRLADGDAPSGERTRLLADLQAVAGRGACHHPDGVTRLVASAIATFDSDVAEHAAGRLCGGAHRRTVPVPEVRR